MLETRRLDVVEPLFGLQAASRLLAERLAPWMQELGLLVESVEAGRPPGAQVDWQPGAVLRLPFTQKICREGGVACGQALAALADAAMVIACAAAWNGYRPMAPIDQTMHFLRPVNFDVVADARMVRIGRDASFGRVMLYSVVDTRPVGMVAAAYAMT
jgi:uncharacterized protein (TIGR00369 family)